MPETIQQTMTEEFVQVLQPDLEMEKPSAMLRLAILVGPPEGVDPTSPMVLDLIFAASLKWRDIKLHPDWLEIASQYRPEQRSMADT
jgi:hypothetical protein